MQHLPFDTLAGTTVRGTVLTTLSADYDGEHVDVVRTTARYRDGFLTSSKTEEMRITVAQARELHASLADTLALIDSGWFERGAAVVAEPELAPTKPWAYIPRDDADEDEDEDEDTYVEWFPTTPPEVTA